MFQLRKHQEVLLLLPTGNSRIRVSTRNGRVSFRCTGNETLSTLYSAALMTLPVPTNWCTRNVWILCDCCLTMSTPTIFWTVAFSNSWTENKVSRNNVMHRLNPLLHPNIIHYNYRVWVLYLITYHRNSAAL